MNNNLHRERKGDVSIYLYISISIYIANGSWWATDGTKREASIVYRIVR